MAEFLAQIEFWWWWALALAFLGLEVLTPGIFFLWFSIAATATGAIALALPDIGWVYQLLIFAVLAVAATALRFLWPRTPRAAEEVVNEVGQRFQGRRLVLEAPITGGVGWAKVGDSRWRIVGPDLPAGSHVVVKGLEGTSLRVEAATQS